MEDRPKKPGDQEKRERPRSKKPESNRPAQKESDKLLGPKPILSEQLSDNPGNEHSKREAHLQERSKAAPASEKTSHEHEAHRDIPKQTMQQETRKTISKTQTQEGATICPEEKRYAPNAEQNEPIRPAETLAAPIASLRSEHDRSVDNKEPVQPQLFRPAQETSESSHPKKMPRIALAQQVTKHTEKAAAEIREQIDEQLDMSPSEYAEQKTEQYTGVVVHRAESAVDRATNKLRERTVRHFREKREEQRQADRECDQADAEVQSAETDSHSEPMQEGYRYPETEVDAVVEPEHLTYRDRPEQMQQTKPAAIDSTAGSSNERRGGRNHAQRQAQRSDWETNASGYQSSGAAGYNAAYPASEAQHSAVSPAQRLASGTEKEAHTAAQTANHGIKATQQAAKTTEQTAKTVQKTAKTTQQTAKTAQKSAQASAKAARAAKETAVKTSQALIKAGKAVGKAIVTIIKAIIAELKALIAAIAEGGWVAVLVIALIAIFAILFTSAFGVFWSNETSEGRPMTEAVQRINSEYESEINKVIEEYEKDKRYDEVKVVYKGDGDGDSASVNNWSDVLAVYSVFTTTDPDNPRDVITPTAEDEARIREIFNVMNKASYSTKVKEEEDEEADVPKPTPDADGNIPETEPVMKTVLYLTITYQAMTYKEAAQYYGFDEKQMEILEEMMSPQYYIYYAAILGVNLTDGTNLTEIISHLPANSKGAEVVKAALSKLGSPYVLGAKGDKKFDCSGLAYWAIKQVDPALGDKMYTNAAGQARYCYNKGLTVGRSELQPGDLVFWVNLKCEGCHRWKEIHHVGIYIGDGKVCEASSGHGRVIVRDLWESKNWPIYMFGRPYSD